MSVISGNSLLLVIEKGSIDRIGGAVKRYATAKVTRRQEVRVNDVNTFMNDMAGCDVNVKVLTEPFSTFGGNNLITLDESDDFITESPSSNNSISFAANLNNNKGYTLRVGEWCAAYLAVYDYWYVGQIRSIDGDMITANFFYNRCNKVRIISIQKRTFLK